MTLVDPLVQRFVESYFGGAPFEVGDTVRHPSGRTVKIVDGQYWGTFGISNFWYWQEVHADGSLGPREHGYGWQPETVH